MQRKDLPRLTVINGGAPPPADTHNHDGQEPPASAQAIRSCLEYLWHEARRADLELPAHLIAVAKRSLDEEIEARHAAAAAEAEEDAEHARAEAMPANDPSPVGDPHAFDDLPEQWPSRSPFIGPEGPESE